MSYEGHHRRQRFPSGRWLAAAALIGILLGAMLATIVISIQANDRLGQLLMASSRTAAEQRHDLACSGAALIGGQRTILLAIRDLIEPDQGPIPPETQAALDQIDRRIAQLAAAPVAAVGCEEGGT